VAPSAPAEPPPKKGGPPLGKKAPRGPPEVLAPAKFTPDGPEAALRPAAESRGIKAGKLFEPIRVAVCGRKTAPPLFGTLEVLGRETCLKRIAQAIDQLKKI